MDASPASAEDEEQTATAATTKPKLKPRPERRSSRAHIVRPKTPTALRLGMSRKSFTCTDCRQWFPAATTFFTTADRETNWHWCPSCALKIDPEKVTASAPFLFSSLPSPTESSPAPVDDSPPELMLRDLTPVGIPSIDDALVQSTAPAVTARHTVLMFELKIRGRQLFQLRFGRE